MTRIAYIESQLDSFKDSLELYRQQTRSWYARALDQVSEFADLPSLLGMERLIKVGTQSTAVGLGDTDFMSSVSQCPLSGILEIESRFESVHEIPLGDLPIEVIPLAGGPSTHLQLGRDGKARFKGEPGKFYRVRVQGAVSPEQIDQLFNSYDGLNEELERWLREQWQTFKPQWFDSSTSGVASAVGEGLMAGSWQALLDVWDSLSLLLEILKNPKEHAEQLGDSALELIRLAEQSPELMARAMLVASDEAVLFLLLRTASIWLSALPPSLVAGQTAEAMARTLTTLLIDLVLALILTLATQALGVAYLSRRIARYGSQLLNAAKGFLREVASLLERFMGYLAHYKAVAARGLAGGQRNGILQLRWNGKRNSTLEQHERRDDAPRQATNPNGQSSEPAAQTKTQGCPVSLVSGEELLSLTDGALNGLLPFAWTRLYRTSAVELDCGLGPGWSHALAHTLAIDGEEVIWTNEENCRTIFPVPGPQRPTVHNSLSGASIHLGERRHEWILTRRAKQPRFYHFEQLQLVAISDCHGNRLTLNRDRLGRINRIDNGAGFALYLHYRNHHITQVDYQEFRPADTLENSWYTLQNLATYDYDQRFRLVEVRNANGDSERYRYDDHHVILERHLAGGVGYFWAWEREGKAARCIRHWASFSQMDDHFHWADDGSVGVVHQDGSESRFVHDPQARLLLQRNAAGAEQQNHYDTRGRRLSAQLPCGAIHHYRYDANGRLTTVIPGEDEPTHYEYRNGGLFRARRGDAQWTWRHNPQGDVTRQTDPNGHHTHYRYNRHGQQTAITYSDGSRHQRVWNALGQLLEEQLPDGRQRHFRYDASGRQIARESPHGRFSQFEWDALGRLSGLQYPDGSRRSWRYNPYNQLTEERDELGRVTRFNYADGLDRVSCRSHADSSRIQYRYDNRHLALSEITNESGQRYSLDYTPNGLIREETGFDGERTTYAYDLAGQLLEKREYGSDNQPLLSTYQRDSEGRLLLKTLADGRRVEYRYDSLGRLCEVDDGEWPLSFEYDLAGQLTAEHQGWATLRYRYGAMGQVIHCRLPDHNQLDYHYLPGGDLDSIDLNGECLTRHQFKAGQERRRQQGALHSDFQYDCHGRLLNHRLGTTERAVFSQRFAYEANGNLNTLDDSREGRRQFLHDPRDRLLEVRGARAERFAHDPAGNLISEHSAAFENNRLQRQGDCVFAYDAFGNQISERRGERITHYRYNCEHRLIGVSLPDGREVKYRYDAFGRRIAKEVDGGITEYFWQGERLVAEQGPEQQRSFVYEPGSFRPLALLNGRSPEQTTALYYQLDHLGAVQSLTDPAGSIRWSARYRAYGSIAEQDVAEIDNPLRFQGQYFDRETGLHYNRHRYYNPQSGRYLTPDPSKLAGGLNSYRYTPNPTGWVDPLGLSGKCPGGNKGGCKPPDDISGNTVDEGAPTLPASDKPREYLYRGDTRKPSEIFEDGFKSRGDSNDLYLHMLDSGDPPSNFISTSTDKAVAIDFGTKFRTTKGFVYSLNRIEGRDINKEFGRHSEYTYEKEIAIPERIKPDDILGATPLKANGDYVGYSIPNFRNEP